MIGGILNISGASIVVGNSVLDSNDGGKVGQAQSFASGTVGAPMPSAALSSRSRQMAIPAAAVPRGAWIHGEPPDQIQLVETNDTLGGDLGGTALGQGSNTGTVQPGRCCR